MIQDRGRIESGSVQRCAHGECPYISEHGKCLHLVVIDGADVCMAGMGSKPVHTYDEIARILGVSKQTVMLLEQRALTKMRKTMEKNLEQEGLSSNDLFPDD